MERGRRIATFCYDNWLCPAGVETPGELLKVKRLKLDICLKQREAIACELDGVQIGTGSNALCYLYLALSGYHHTALHAYANWAAIPNHEDAHLNRAATWTLATNAVALFTGRAFQQNPDTMKEALRYNCRRGIPKHGSGALLRELARHSRYTLFVYRARGAHDKNHRRPFIKSRCGVSFSQPWYIHSTITWQRYRWTLMISS